MSGVYSVLRRRWPALSAALALPIALLGVCLAAPAAGAAAPGPTPTGTAVPSTPNTSPFPPSAPTNLRAAQVSTTSIVLNWTASTPGCCAVSGYDITYTQAFNDVIYTKSVGNVTTATIYTQPTGQYRFSVTAHDDVGHRSAASDSIVVVTPATDTGPDTVPPTAPGTLTKSDVTPTTITLNWTPATDNVGVTGYNVYRFDGLYISTLLATVPGTTYQVQLTTSMNMFYVRARDAVGNLSPASNTVTADPAPPTDLPPSAPTNLTATKITSTSVTLTWTAAAPGCCAIAGYTVGYFPAFYDLGTSVDVGNVTTATITLKPATQYRLFVSAKDSAGHSSPTSDSVTIVTPATDTGPDTVPPGAPGALTATGVTATTATLNWSPATDNVGVTGYNVYRWDGVLASTLLATVPGTSYTVPLSSSVPNHFYVRTRDAAGNVSIATNEVAVSPPAPPPPAPTCKVSYRTQSQWPGGFVAAVSIQNTGSAPLDGWTLTFVFPGDQQITSAWSATYTQTGAVVAFRNLTWNGTVAPGGSVSFGFQGRWTASNTPPTSFALNGASCATA
ncbi:cellulose binding domain-containing protein [Plantactinospora siamensis]|uniref:Cellulose binding domain-containing protein n=1 Tax=Plantactinospora siamensis TaxID=555372 RepID=A0ABV6NRI6_9ACTN